MLCRWQDETLYALRIYPKDYLSIQFNTCGSPESAFLLAQAHVEGFVTFLQLLVLECSH